jgi:hypothetical protein
METKDWALVLGVLVTLVLGLYNLRHNKRTAFINTVTSERVKWISKLRENISKLYSLCDKWYRFHPQPYDELFEEIEQLKFEIRLQLNRSDPEDQELERLLERLPNPRQSMAEDEYNILRNALIATSQDMLKREWEKVKEEAERGNVSSTRR